ncbi:MAG: 50S ribosomal protein L10 [Patescibacteria group bacterium]|nr:50S ribosomal protein L10 [Patescibacteria group bacterium]
MVAQKKILQVKTLSEIINQKENFLLIKFEKTTHQALETLRKELKKTNTNLKVIKNTLFEKAVNINSKKNLLLKNLEKNFPLKDTSALVTFDKDWSEGLKTLFNFFKKEKTLSFKFGIIDKNIYQSSDLEKIAQLPGKNELLGKIISSLKAPANRIVYALKYNTNKLVYILKEKSKVKN